MPDFQNTTGDFCLEDSHTSFRLHWNTGQALLGDVTIVTEDGHHITIPYSDLLNIAGMATSHIIELHNHEGSK